MLLNRGSFFLRTEDQANVFDGIRRFRSVSSQALLDRGTVRRVGVRGSILEFAFERKNMLLHIFRLEAKRNARGIRPGSARAASWRDGLRI
jgi:hypothetical protein